MASEYRYVDSVQVTRYTNQAIRLAKKANYPEGIADSWYHLGWLIMFKGYHSQAGLFFTKSLQIAQKANYKKGIANAYNGKGVIYRQQGDYPKALEYYKKSLVLKKQIGDKKGIAISYNNIGTVYNEQGNYPKALKAYQHSLHIQKQIGNKRGIAWCYNNLGKVYYRQGNHHMAFKFLAQGLQVREQIKDKNGIAYSYLSLGKLALAQKQTKQAQKYFEQALALRQQAGQKGLSAKTLVNLGITWYSQQNYHKAETCLHKGTQAALKIGNPTIARDGAEYLAKVYQAMGKPQKALENYILFKKMADSLLNKKNIQQITRMEEQFVAQQREDSLLQAQHQYNTDLEKRRLNQRNIYTTLSLIVALALVLVLLLFYYNTQYKNRRIQASDKEITQQQEELKVKQASLEQAQLLTDIGQEITSSLSLDKVFDIAYAYLNQWMDAYNLGIGIYEPQNEQITVRLTFGKTGRMKPYTQSMGDKNHLIVWCIEHCQAIRIDDFAREHQDYISHYEPLPDSPDKEPVSAMYVPLMIQEKIVGAISIHSYQKNAYTDYHFSLFENISLYVAIAIDNAWVYKKVLAQKEEILQQQEQLLTQHTRLEQSHRDIQLLTNIGQQITSSLDLEKILYTVYEHINQLMDAVNFSIGLYEPQKQQLIFRFTIANGQRTSTHVLDMNNKDQLAAWSIDNKQPYRVGDMVNDYQQYIPNIETEIQLLTAVSIPLPASSLGIPLMIQDKVIGILIVDSYQKNVYTNYHVNLLKNLSLYVATAINNARVYKKAVAQKEEIRIQNEEIHQQKEELLAQHAHLEQTHQNMQLLSSVGQQITSLLDLDEIFYTIYDYIKQKMDVANFWIGFHDSKKEIIAFKFSIVQGKRVQSSNLDMTNKDQLAVWCIDYKQSLKIGNLSNEYQQYVSNVTTEAKVLQHIPVHPPTSILGIPLIVQNKTIGIIMVSSQQENAYTDYHFNLLKNLSLYMAIAVDNAKVYQKLEKSHQNSRLLSTIGQQITSSLDLEKILYIVYEHINQLMDAANFAIGIYQPQKEQLSFRFNIVQEERKQNIDLDMKNKNQLSVWCIDHRKPFKIGDLMQEYQQYVPNIEVESKLLHDAFISLPSSVLGIPLIVHDKTIGIMIINSYKRNAYTEHHFNLLSNLSLYVAIAIDNAQVYKKTVMQTEEINKQNNLINLLLNENQHRVGNDFVAMYAKVAAIGEAQLNEEARQLVEQTKKRIHESMELQNLLSYPFHAPGSTCDSNEIYDRLHAIVHTLYELHFDKFDNHSLTICNEVNTLNKNRLVMIAFCVFELVKNACKYAFRGKSPDYLASINITLSIVKETVTLCLKNNGKGFKSKLFDEAGEFAFKKHKISKGMSIVQAITTREGGNFSIRTAGVHPEVEEGSVVVCTFG